MLKFKGLKKTLALCICALMFALVLGGCDSNEPASKDGAKSASTSKSADTLTFSQSDDVKNLDPALSEDNYTNNVTANIFESLLTTEEKDGELKVVPKLAEHWKESEDRKSYTFKLKTGVKFHDGTDFNAEAVKINIDRQLEAIENKNANFQYATISFNNVASVEVLDVYTLKITLKEPQTSFLGILAMDIGVGIASPKAIKAADKDKGINDNPVGTGPYKFVHREAGQFIKLARNEEYWGEKAKCKNLVVKKLDPDAAIIALKNKEVDVVKECPNTNKAKVEENGGLFKKDPFLCTSYMFFNHKGEVFKDKNVRKAFCQAVNVPELVRSLYKGYAERATCFLPSNIGGFSKETKGIEFDADAAKRTLESAGVKKIKIATYSGTKPYNSIGGIPLAEAVQAYFKRVGVEATIDSREFKDFQSLVKRGEFDIAFCGWGADYVDPSNFLQIITSDSAMNYGRYSNKEYDEIFKQADTIPDGKERNEMYSKIEKLALEDAAWLPLSHMSVANAINPNLKGFKQPPLGVIPFHLISK